MDRTHVVAVALFALACGDTEGAVAIEIVTNYVPGDDFVEVRVDLRNDDRALGPMTLGAERGDDYSRPVRVALFPRVPSGIYTGHAELRGASGELVRMGSVRASVNGDAVITVVVSMSCTGVCADAGLGDAGPIVGDDAGVDAGPPTLDLDEVCEAFASRRCEGTLACCSTLPVGYTLAECRFAFLANCNAILGRVVGRAELRYDSVAAYAALQTLDGLVAVCDPAVADWDAGRDGMAAPLVGARGEGVSCTPLDESDPIERILSVISCSSGACRRRSLGDWSCVSAAPDGESCVLGFECASGRCEWPGMMTPLTRVCGSGELNGSPCNAHDECASNLCDATSRTCAARTVDNAYCPP